MKWFQGTHRSRAARMLKGLVGAASLGAAASAHAEVTLILAVEITDININLMNTTPDYELGHVEVGDVFLVTVVYDESVSGVPSGSQTVFPDALSYIGSVHGVDGSPECLSYVASWSPSFDALDFRTGDLRSSQVIRLIDEDQDYSRDELPACILLGNDPIAFERGTYEFESINGTFNAPRNIQIRGTIVRVIEGNCNLDNRAHPIAEWELEPPYGVGDDTMKVRLKGTKTLGSVGNTFWNALGNAPEPVDAPDNSIDAIVELPPGTHTYELIVFNEDETWGTADAVTITIADESEPDCPADQNFDGQLTPADFTAWINNYNMGC